ncbi:Hypothetical protein CAP_4502 [Chondromyces apiculatus DSM 436]|uniref:Uncharacterized protein n=1 Tax=Chondromyces apiculatus DSM 436 TaxID=1192034 RepID=A0A017T5R8_9BACT|nr:Hypothetical protein CAP_4502 [Chondromyces apiculatus DSM 436]
MERSAVQSWVRSSVRGSGARVPLWRVTVMARRRQAMVAS